MLMALVPSIAAITTNLLAIAPAREPPHANGHPAQTCHHRSKTTTRAGASGSLRDFQNVEHMPCGVQRG